jgi:hypothetical protein
VDSGFGLSLSLRSQGLRGGKHQTDDTDEWTRYWIRGVREPRQVEVVLEAAEENSGLVEVVIGMIAVVNSKMVREMQRHGVQIEGF